MTARVYSRVQHRLVDQIATDEFGIPAVVLMENAGRGCAELLLARPPCRACVICCGPGNNGADGMVMARHLAIAGVAVKVLVFASPERLSELAVIQRRILSHTSIPVQFQPQPDLNWLATELTQVAGVSADWLVDAMLGTGSSGQVRPPFDRVIEALNASATRRCAIDLPTGLDCDRPEPHGPIVRADLTATMVALKPALVNSRYQRWCGEIEVVDIGVPLEVLRRVEHP